MRLEKGDPSPGVSLVFTDASPSLPPLALGSRVSLPLQLTHEGDRPLTLAFAQGAVVYYTTGSPAPGMKKKKKEKEKEKEKEKREYGLDLVPTQAKIDPGETLPFTYEGRLPGGGTLPPGAHYEVRIHNQRKRKRTR